ncbi:Ig domain-containing protein [Candidatus Binatia bacterium]|nr:Ig domain-containing protein [Candidatus Binatia bacterium]
MTRSQRILSLAMLSLALAARPARATTVIGDLNNFDTINDTGQTCYGFEIEIDDIHSTDVTYTYDWNHYGAPKIREDVSDPLHPKVFVRYESTRDAGGVLGANGSFTNQAIPSLTPPAGHDCTNPSVNEGCEHFGVGYYGNNPVIKYSWLVDDGAGNLVTFGSPVGVAAPKWQYTPPAGAQPAQVVAAIPAPALPVPAGKKYGDPVWVKVIKTTTHNANPVPLDALISDDADGDGAADWQNAEPAEVETEFKLLQTNTDGNGVKDELAGAGDDMGDGSENVTRRYEFYRYDAAPDTLDGETGEAMCDEVNPTTDVNDPAYLHGLGDHVAVTDANGDTYYVDCAAQVVVGTYIGAQMAGFDAAAPLGLIDNLQDAEKDQAYLPRTVVVGGDSPYTIAITSGSLPAGLTIGAYMDPNTGLTAPGVLAGTPSTAGDYTFTVQATDAGNATTSKTFTLHVAGAIEPPVVPSCALGAGIAQTPPKLPKNSGRVKISKGLTASAAVKDTKLTVTGTIENCQNFPVVPGAAGPITGGSFRLTLEIPPGSTCASLAAGEPVKGSVAITWTTPDPAKPGKLKKVGSEKTGVDSYAEPVLDPITLGIATQDFGVKSVVPDFATKHAVLSLATDQSAAEIALGCGGKKGLAALTFTGVNGPSTLEIH